MSELKFKLGDNNIKAIYFDEETIRVGECNVTEISVVMENGQMDGVPWLAVFKGKKISSKYNAAFVLGVEYF